MKFYTQSQRNTERTKKYICRYNLGLITGIMSTEVNYKSLFL